MTSGWRRNDRFERASTASDAVGRTGLGRWVRVEVRAQVGLLLGHRLEQQTLLRGEVAVDGAERDIGRRGDVAHLHRVEATVGGQSERRVEHAPAPCGLALGQRSGKFGGGHDAKVEHVSISVATRSGTKLEPWTCSKPRIACSRGICRSSRTTRSPSSGQFAEIQPGLGFVDAFANSAAIDTDDGLVVVDTSGMFQAKSVHETMRRWSGSRLDTAIFTHGHIDHVFGVELYEAEARAERVGTAAGRRARARAGTVRSVQAHRGLQRGDQPAAVQGTPAALADSTTATRTRRTAATWCSKSAANASSSTTRAARPTTARGCGHPTARSCSRATCSSGRRRTAATRRRCSATRATGRGVPRDGGAATRCAAARPRPADRRRRPRASGARPTAPSSWRRCSTRRSR